MNKRATVLVAIGAAVFVLGAGVVLLSLRHSGGGSRGTAVAAESGASGGSGPAPTVLVAVRAIPAGTAGAEIIEQQMVRSVPVHQAGAAYRSDDLSAMGDLNQKALATAVEANQPIESSNLRSDAGTLIPPPGEESVAITISSAAASGAGYVSPGDNVDVYANVTKASTGASGSTNLGAAASAMPLPCVALVQSSLQVLDISATVPSYGSDPTPEGRQIPSSFTVLLAATPAQARSLIFYTDNESLYLTKASTTEAPVSKSTCSALTTSPQLTTGS